ncbi:MAG: aromatic ring-hydroxylating dioxygenase subunit alpha [Chloroflexi bacterium]|nr:aromatic ring-hydroxylating dioxygenase subunit alpha [Chloroflexota bacterium]
MLTQELNELLTRVGPGTPMGELQRRYWHPIATSGQLRDEPVMAVKLLGENLALYRTERGALGLVSQRCPHRGASLAYGIPEEEGLRCPYHGWRFDAQGACNEQPAEPADSTFKDRIRIPAYPVQELGGLIWAYLGPEPVPLLPRFDVLVRDDLKRDIGLTQLPVNWLQVMENSLDPVHLEYLHSKYLNFVLKRQGKPAVAEVKHHAKIGFDVFEYGIRKRRLLEGQSEDVDEWTTGHPILFPNTLAVGQADAPHFHVRVPMDDHNTLHFWYGTEVMPPGTPPQSYDEIGYWDFPYVESNGRIKVDTVFNQDMMVWLTQGELSDRTTERLGTSDKGIILYRQVLLEQIEKVKRGQDPLGVVRDRAKNEPMIVIPRENRAHFTFASETFLTDADSRSMDTFWTGSGKKTVEQAMKDAANATHS